MPGTGGSQCGAITIVNVYAPNIETSKYVKHILTDIKGEIDNNTVIVETLIPL